MAKLIYMFGFIVLMILLTIYACASSKPVDVVYTWVDEHDPEREYYKMLNHIPKNDGNQNENRFNNSEELRYSLRSVAMYCPWVRKVFVVVKDGQCPKFLNLKNKKVSLIYHSQFIPKENLPTFNSLTIEQYIHRIPGLSDFYIYFNDDMFVTKKMLKKDFFKNNKPVVNLQKKPMPNNVYAYMPDYPYHHPRQLYHSLYIATQLFDVDFSVAQFHTPSPCYKPWEYELEAIIRKNNFWNDTQFRTNNNVAINNFLRNIFYYYKGCKLVDWNENYVTFASPHCGLQIGKNREFMCINEIQKPCKTQYLEYMTLLYPHRCEFENEI